jgi:thiol:disulfide interchange protein
LTNHRIIGNIIDLFFDPITKASVKLGAQANTLPFGDAGAAANNGGGAAAEVTTRQGAATGTCLPAQTVTVTAAASAPTADATSPVDKNDENTSTNNGSGTALRTDTIDTGALDFGLCTNPSVEFVSLVMHSCHQLLLTH